MVDFTLDENFRVPVWRVCAPTTWRCRIPVDDACDLLLALRPDLWGCAFRAVFLDRLGTVLEHGIDVTPTDSPIYVDDLSKASEYGDWPKVVLALRWDKLDRTFREVPADLPRAELDALKRIFTTELRSTDGKSLWLSRLRPDDRALAKPYEVDYARWIPGDPFDALVGVIVLDLMNEQPADSSPEP